MKSLFIVALLLLPHSFCWPEEKIEASGCETSVVKVIDGDTVILSNGDKVRIMYVNTPEKGENLSAEAKIFTNYFVSGKCAVLNPSKPEKDKFGRLLADVLVDGKSLADSLVENGMAHVMLIPPYDRERAAKLLTLQTTAKKMKKGIWAEARYQGGLIITSFRANPAGDEWEDPNLEYLRIANISGKKINLKDFKLTNRKGEVFLFPDVEIENGNTVIVRSGKGVNKTAAGKQIEIHLMSEIPVWSNHGDNATLYDRSGNIVDMVEYRNKKKK